MGSANAGKWIFGGVIYFWLSFIICFSMISIAQDHPTVDVSNIGYSENELLGESCNGVPYESCIDLSISSNVTGIDCYAYNDCRVYGSAGENVTWYESIWFNLGTGKYEIPQSDLDTTCKGDSKDMGECSFYNTNETMCINAGCEYGYYDDYHQKMEDLQSKSSRPTKSIGAVVSTFQMMFGFNATVDGQGEFSIIFLMLLTLMPMSMIIFGVYSALRG